MHAYKEEYMLSEEQLQKDIVVHHLCCINKLQFLPVRYRFSYGSIKEEIKL